MQQHTKRITAAVTPDIAAIYEKLAVASGRTLSSIVSDVLASRARECLYFLRWLGSRPYDAAEHAQAVAAVRRIARTSLIAAVRDIDPTYRTPTELMFDRSELAEAVLTLLEKHQAQDGSSDGSMQLLSKARDAVADRCASRWRDGGSFISLPDELEVSPE